MQIKVKPIRGQRLEIQLDQTKLMLQESDCQQMRDALVSNLKSFARHDASTWDEAQVEFQQLLPSLEHLEKFNDNELVLLMREFDFTLLYRVCQQKPLTTLLKKLETALGRREIDRLVIEGERLPSQPLWEVNLRISAMVRTIERMTDEGEIRPPKMPTVSAATKIPLSQSNDAGAIRQVLKKMDSFSDKTLLVVFKQIPPRELAKLWFIMEEFSEASLVAKFNKLIPSNMQEKLKPAKPSQLSPANARKTSQLVVEVIKSLKNKKPADDQPGSSGPILV